MNIMMGNQSDRPKEVLRWLLPVLVLSLLGGVLVYAKDEVDRRVARAGGAWSIDHGTLPSWCPRGFRGELETLRSIPSQVSLQSVRWRDQVRAELLKNPWISQVRRVERTADGVGFQGDFVRPSVGVRCDGGWLLVDGSGTVIDFQAGDFLAASWGIPEYIPEQGTLPRMDPGQSLRGSEFSELLSLSAVLWRERVFERVPGFIHELAVHHDSLGERLWSFHTNVGIPLRWGRAPASDAPKVSSIEGKLECLRKVVEVRDRLEKSDDVPGISLCSGQEPLVVEDW
ncbi:MAG: hypothetical protein HRU16_03580 [Planctomycetes bacterium]|nr:hypothetical protein [Planctomycetota bacterium]